MTHKQWFNNVLHLHPVPEEGARICHEVNNISTLLTDLSLHRDLFPNHANNQRDLYPSLTIHHLPESDDNFCSRC